MNYVINGLVFASKAAATRHVKSILAKGAGTLTGDDHDFMVALFERHPSAPEVSGDPITAESCHVDHVAPMTFEAIVQAFLAAIGIDAAQVEYLDGDNVTESQFADRELSERFALFHRERAVLRVVSKRANLSLLRRKS